MSHTNFSSFPTEVENTFVVYEEQSANSQKKAWTISLAVAGAVFLLAVILQFAVEPKKDDLAKDMDMSSLSREGDKAEADGK